MSHLSVAVHLVLWTHVIKEPVVREADVNNADGGLLLDLGIRGVWQPQVEALFDVKVVDTDAPSHRTRKRRGSMSRL